MIMMRSIAAALAMGLFASGCSLFQKKEEPQQNSQSGESAEQGGGGGIDPTQFVQAQSPVGWAAGKAKTGWSATQKMDSSGQVMNTSWAVVGESGDSWLVEHQNPAMAAMAKGYIMGLTVRKEDGKVTKAVLGKPGEEGKPIKINENPPVEGQKGPEPTNEDVKIKLGTFPAKKYVNKFAGADGKEQTHTTWMGNGGELNNVLLKAEGPGGNYELSEMPEESQVKVGDSSLSVTKYAYSNGLVQWVATGSPVLAVFFPYGEDGKSMFKMSTQGMTMEITEVSEAAKPQLKW